MVAPRLWLESQATTLQRYCASFHLERPAAIQRENSKISRSSGAPDDNHYVLSSSQSAAHVPRPHSGNQNRLSTLFKSPLISIDDSQRTNITLQTERDLTLTLQMRR